MLLRRAERHDHRAPAVRHLGGDLGPRERRQRARRRRAGDAVEGRVEPAPRPRGLIDAARVELPEDEGVQMRLVLEERERTGEGRGQSDQALSHRIEHRLETREQIGLARGVGPRQRQEGRGPPEQLLERPVGDVQHVPHRRRRLQQTLHHLVLEVRHELAVGAGRHQHRVDQGHGRQRQRPRGRTLDVCGDALEIEGRQPARVGRQRVRDPERCDVARHRADHPEQRAVLVLAGEGDDPHPVPAERAQLPLAHPVLARRRGEHHLAPVARRRQRQSRVRRHPLREDDQQLVRCRRERAGEGARGQEARGQRGMLGRQVDQQARVRRRAADAGGRQTPRPIECQRLACGRGAQQRRQLRDAFRQQRAARHAAAPARRARG